jgi:hypothetical protein
MRQRRLDFGFGNGKVLASLNTGRASFVGAR